MPKVFFFYGLTSKYGAPKCIFIQFPVSIPSSPYVFHLSSTAAYWATAYHGRRRVQSLRERLRQAYLRNRVLLLAREGGKKSASYPPFSGVSALQKESVLLDFFMSVPTRATGHRTRAR